MKKKLILHPSAFILALAALALPAALFAAPVVSNVAFVQQPDGAGSTEVVVTYDLVSPNGNATVSLLYSTNGGTSFSTATTTTGAVGAGVTPGTGKTIDWAVATDLPGQAVPGNFLVRVLAEDGAPIPLDITSNGGAVHQLGTQTLTFTFAEPVTGFDASDVTVTNGTKGTFAGSGAVYTLAVTSPGGAVAASVGAAAATAASGSGNGNAAATPFSNFYQDTWTLTLPGSVPMELIRIPAGTFTMGSADTELSRNSNETQHQVTLTQDFYLGKTEVTQAQWLAIRGTWPGTAPSVPNGLGDDFPAYFVSYNDIQAFMTDLDTAITEPGIFSLPTESQWEYGCRAGTTTRFNFGDGFASDEFYDTGGGRGDNMWFAGNNSPTGAKAAGQKPANAWGLRDMHGNLWEFCADWLGTYPAGPVTDPTGPDTGSSRVLRGGGRGHLAFNHRSAHRNNTSPPNRLDHAGFRVAAFRSVPLTITSTEMAPVHQTATQTLTFTFGEPVTGFDSSDVTVTGATMGTFTPVSSTVYTLEITAVANGAVTVSVAANAAVESDPFYVGTAGGSFSNTYDSVAPSVTSTNPANAAVIPPPTSILVTFSETVTGLTAGQLTVNGSPATTVMGTNPYTFSGFAEPGDGAIAIAVALAAGSTTDAAGNPFAGDSWGYTAELLRFVPVPAGTFTMGRTDSGDDATYGEAQELPNHQVTLSAYDIGKFEVTNAQFAIVMNWALAQGYLANDASGAAYAGSSTVFLMAPDATATRQLLFTTYSSSDVGWNGTAFEPRIKDSLDLATYPMVCVTWYGAVSFCNFLAGMEGKPLAIDASTWELVDADPVTAGLQYVASYRLPTESEWERAAAWDGTRRWTYSILSDTLTGSARVNYDGVNPMNRSEFPRTSPVGWFNGVNISPRGSVATVDSPSPVGAYDMSGNVWEWCHDWYGSYTASSKTNPTGPETSELGTPFRRLRGGGANRGAHYSRSARRWTNPPSGWFTDNGFRAVAVRSVPLTITSTEMAPVHQTATQTLTFTFGEPVTGFDASDVTVAGATKGTFTPVSSTIYTLDVTGTGGTVSASVAADTAQVSLPYTGTQAVTFSNFYQDTWTITLPGAVPMELIRIPAGTFTMGSPPAEVNRDGDETQFTATHSQDFYMGRTEVTQAQWSALQSFPQTQDFVGTTIPVHKVTHDEVVLWMGDLNTAITEAGTFALPTEAQWEYAARAGTATRMYFGDTTGLPDDCSTGEGREANMWFCGNASGAAQPVGQKLANPWGLRDVHGNVWEWVADWYGTYPAGPVTNYTGPGSGTNRIIRGGGHNDNPAFTRSAGRYEFAPNAGQFNIGFRVMATR